MLRFQAGIITKSIVIVFGIGTKLNERLFREWPSTGQFGCKILQHSLEHSIKNNNCNKELMVAKMETSLVIPNKNDAQRSLSFQQDLIQNPKVNLFWEIF